LILKKRTKSFKVKLVEFILKAIFYFAFEKLIFIHKENLILKEMLNSDGSIMKNFIINLVKKLGNYYINLN